MADLVITPANVLAGSNANTETGTAGEAIAAGKGYYLSSTTKKFMLSDSNSPTPEARVPRGYALCSAAANQPLVGQKAGDITLGPVLSPGVTYFQSDTPGGICPYADLGAGEYATVVGVARSTTVMAISILASGVAL